MQTLNSIWMDVAGLVLTADDKRLLRNPLIGGLVLFARNFKSKPQLQVLVDAVRALRPNLIIAVDHEGGRVQRFKAGFTRIPPMAELGGLYNRQPFLARSAAFDTAALIATELTNLGIDLNLAPVLDLDYGCNLAIGNRAFHANPNVVADLGLAYLKGLQSVGMASVAKHFPGHGFVSVDSHLGLPVDNRPYSALFEIDMLPFRKLIAQGLTAVMPAHILYSAVDSEIANFSQKWLKNILRQRLGFDGLVISDDLHMQGAKSAGNMAARVFKALQAGCDCVLICNDRAGLIRTLKHLRQTEAVDTSMLRANV